MPHRHVVVRHPLGDVRRWQPADHAGILRQDYPSVGAVVRREDVAVRQLHALRVASGARRVDEGDDGVGGDGSDRLLEVVVARPSAVDDLVEREFLGARFAVHHDDLDRLGQLVADLPDDRQERLLDHDHRHSGVVQHVDQLLGREGNVDRQGRRTEQDACEIADVELRPVGQHQGELVVGGDTELVQPLGYGFGPLAGLAPGPGHGCVAQAAEGNLVGSLRDGGAKSNDDGLWHVRHSPVSDDSHKLRESHVVPAKTAPTAPTSPLVRCPPDPFARTSRRVRRVRRSGASRVRRPTDRGSRSRGR